MSRAYNFSAGPAVLPLEVLQDAQKDLVDYKGCGMSVMEMSHRGKDYDAIHQEAIATFKELCGLGDDWSVCFIQGGASMQFAMIPMNFLPKGGAADYAKQGTWSNKALKEGQKVAALRGATVNRFRLLSPLLERDDCRRGAQGVSQSRRPAHLRHVVRHPQLRARLQQV